MAFKKTVQVRMDQELSEKFDLYCKEKGLSKSEVFRRWVLSLKLQSDKGNLHGREEK